MDFKITEQQRKIIEAPEENVCVLASAGTSKTFCLIERIKWLVEQGIDPKKIIAITFTRNAATEVAQRLAPIQIGYCGTIHAYANYLLLLYGVDTKSVIEKEKFDDSFIIKDVSNNISGGIPEIKDASMNNANDNEPSLIIEDEDDEEPSFNDE